MLPLQAQWFLRGRLYGAGLLYANWFDKLAVTLLQE